MVVAMLKIQPGCNEMHSVQTWELHIEYNCRFHNVTRCTRIVAHRTASDDQ